MYVGDRNAAAEEDCPLWGTNISSAQHQTSAHSHTATQCITYTWYAQYSVDTCSAPSAKSSVSYYDFLSNCQVMVVRKTM